jgi:hypothetical protein
MQGSCEKNPGLTTTTLATMQDLLKQTLWECACGKLFYSKQKYAGKNTELIFFMHYYWAEYFSLLRKAKPLFSVFADCEMVCQLWCVIMLNHFIQSKTSYKEGQIFFAFSCSVRSNRDGSRLDEKKNTKYCGI